MSKKTKEEQLSDYESRIRFLLESELRLKAEHDKKRRDALARDELLPRYTQSAEVAHELAQLRSKIYYLNNSERCIKNARIYRIKRKVELTAKE